MSIEGGGFRDRGIPLLLNCINMDMIIPGLESENGMTVIPIQRAEEECSQRVDGIVYHPSQPNQGHCQLPNLRKLVQ